MATETKPSEDVTRYKVTFVVDNLGKADGELVRFHAPRIVDAIAKALPLDGRFARYHDEVYFEVPVKLGGEKTKTNVEPGTIAYWPMGSAICIFHGVTQPYSPVSVIGTVTSNLEMFREVKSGARVRLEKA
jgi:hypothetical protein